MRLPEEFNILIITLSDRAFKGVYKDLSGPRIKELTEEFFTSLKARYKTTLVLLPDDGDMLREAIINSTDKYDIIITTGGTGIGPRDITIETISPLLTKEIPGVMEYIRIKYGSDNPDALLSRGIAGLMNKTLIYTLPGSVKAVNEYMNEIIKSLEHALLMVHGIDNHMKT